MWSDARFYFAEKGNVVGEDLYRALGRTEEGRYLVVFFIYKRNRTALATSARGMTPKELKRHGKNRSNRDPLPTQFKTIEEFTKFWETHDTEDYPEAWREIPVTISMRARKYPRIVLEPRVKQKINGDAII